MKRFNLLLIVFMFLAGCTHHVSSQLTKKPVLPKSQIIQDWTVSFISISSKNNNLLTYEIELTYTGDAKAENIVFKTGNAISTLHEIEKNQYTRIGSSYSSNETQIQVAVTWNEGDQGFKQTVLFDV